MLLGAVTAACLGAAPAAQAAQIIVDDNGAQCPGAGFTTIQSAVNAAAAGDTVAVCAGTYTEGTAGAGNNALSINKSVNIRGVGADSVIIQPAGDVGEPDPNPPGNGVGPSFRDARGNVVSVGSTTATGATAVTVNISGVTVRGNDRYVESGISYLNANGGVSNSRVTGIVQTQGTGGLGRFGILQRGFGILALSTTAGNYAFTLANSELDAFNKAALLVDSNSVAASKFQGTITDNRIQGGGKITPGLGQNGVQVSQGAGAVLTGNTITDVNFVDPNTAQDSATGILLFAADLTTTSANANNIQGNSYGLANRDINFLPRTTPVSAVNTWWGNPNGPAIGAQATDRGDPVDAPPAVTATPFRTTPLAQAAAPGTPTDSAPTVAITAPADGGTVTPGVATAVAANASDDNGVVGVTFRKGATVLGTDTTAPYTATYTPTAAEAGTSQAIIATAQDTKGQTSTSVVSVRVAGGANAPEDRPPSVAFTSPAENALLPASGTTLTAAATDDRGVANVRFIDDNQTVCVDSSAPFTCAYRPGAGDVGRNTLVAIATDGSGQTAAAIRTVRVNLFVPRSLSSRVSPTRDRRASYRFTTRGTLSLPTPITKAQGCRSGQVSVQVKRGKTTLSTRRANLRRDCTYSTTVTFSSRRRLGRTGRLRFTARFTGNAILGRRTATTRTARAG